MLCFLIFLSVFLISPAFNYIFFVLYICNNTFYYVTSSIILSYPFLLFYSFHLIPHLPPHFLTVILSYSTSSFIFFLIFFSSPARPIAYMILDITWLAGWLVGVSPSTINFLSTLFPTQNTHPSIHPSIHPPHLTSPRSLWYIILLQYIWSAKADTQSK